MIRPSTMRCARLPAACVALAGGLAWTGAPRDASAGGPALVRTVRYSATTENTRVVIDLSKARPYQVRLAPDSASLQVDIPGAVSESSIGEVVVGRPDVRSVVTRTVDAGSAEPRVEITLLLAGPVAWNDFALPAGSGRPARVVIDVRPSPGAAGAAPFASVGSVPPDGSDTSGTPSATSSARAAPPRPFIVAVDAGHGGHDTGTMGRYGLVEKKLTLDIARRVAESLNQRDGIRAVMTRDSDVYLTLPERNQIAEKLQADVFVSVHLNSAPSSSARGAEIYFVAPAGAERAADQEMASGEAAHEFGLDQRDDGDIVHMLLDVNQQSVLARSELLAASILEEVRDRNLLPTRTVKQKSFSVLRTISMPSVLVEAGFLSNSSDAKLVREADGRERIARAIAEGVVDFFRVHPPQRGAEPSAGPVVHRVRSGDTLWTISRLYHTTVNRLCELNGFGKSQELRVGQEIVVRRP